jgi:hypothetical protein
MAESLDLLSVEQGDHLSLLNGATVEVIHNPRDGMWLFCRYLTHPSDSSLIDGKEHAVFAQDIEDTISQKST